MTVILIFAPCILIETNISEAVTASVIRAIDQFLPDYRAQQPRQMTIYHLRTRCLKNLNCHAVEVVEAYFKVYFQ
jgi:hypothetical protein